MIVIDEKYEELIKHLSENFSLSRKQRISKIVGFLSMLCGGILLFFLFVFGDKYLSDPVYVTILALGIWCWGYGGFALITGRAVYSLFYPTITILMIASLPAIAAVITFRYKLWIEILSVSLCAVISVILWGIFLWHTVTKPMKAKQKFVAEHANEISEDYINGSIEDNRTRVFKNERGDIAIIAQVEGVQQNVAVYKNIDGNFEMYCKKSFVELYSAKHYAYEILLSLV